jgi:molybdate transport system substrate-binding protein
MKNFNAFLFSLLSLLFVNAQSLAAEVSVAVAANFTNATRDIVPLFEKVTGHTAKVSFGSTGKLYSQIENGAPFEVFLAADTKRPIKAEKEGLAVPGTRFVYAQGKLVLWSAKKGLFDNGASYLKNSEFKHLALANPKTAPYGLAARQVMEHLGLWPQLQSKLVRGESIAQTFQFVATGNAEIGFVAFSQVKAWQGDAGTAWVIPTTYYAPIDQAAVLLKKGASNPAAQAFVHFLKSDSARMVIESYGYGVE